MFFLIQMLHLRADGALSPGASCLNSPFGYSNNCNPATVYSGRHYCAVPVLVIVAISGCYCKWGFYLRFRRPYAIFAATIWPVSGIRPTLCAARKKVWDSTGNCLKFNLAKSWGNTFRTGVLNIRSINT